MTAEGSQWRLLPHFLIRSTGFPFAHLGRIGFDGCQPALDRWLDAEAAVTAHRPQAQAALAAEAEPATRRLRQRCFKRVAQGRPVGPELGRQLAGLRAETRAALAAWDAAVSHGRECEARARDAFDTELAARRKLLRETVADPRFGEAVWLCSPQMWETGLRRYLAGAGGASDVRRVERQLASYLQRFCAKNDTNAFFGPIDYGGFTDQPAAAVPRPGTTRRRAGFFAHWATVALAEAVAADPAVRPWLRPARSATCRLVAGGSALELPGRGRFRLPAAVAALLSRVDGRRTVWELAGADRPDLGGPRPSGSEPCGSEPSGRQLGGPEPGALEPPDGPVTATLRMLDRLAAAGVIRLAPAVPTSPPRPLPWLRDWVAGLPARCTTRGRWLAEIDALVAIERSYAPATFDRKRKLLATAEARFSGASGAPARRSGGELYADRLLMYEEAWGGVGPLELGPRVRQLLLQRLAPVLDRYAAYACALQERVRGQGATVLATAGPEPGVPVPLPVAVAALRDQPPVPEPTDWREAVLAQLAGRSAEREVELDPARLPPVEPDRLDRELLLSSLDLMLVADDPVAVRAGRFDLVIGECHDALLVWGWPLGFHPDPDAVERAGAAALRDAGNGQVWANVLPTRRVKITPFRYPGPTVVLGALPADALLSKSGALPADILPSESGLPAEPSSGPVAACGVDQMVVPVAEVTAGVVDGRPVLTAPGVGRIGLYNGELHALPHRVFAPPRVVPPPAVETGVHTPRLRLPGVVLQRERWRLPRAELFPRAYTGDSPELLRDYQAAARRFGIPRYTFARVPGDRKPILVDAASWFLLQLLYHHVPPDQEVVLTEMLPGPDQLWLRGPAGRFCAELRMVAYRDRSGTGG